MRIYANHLTTFLRGAVVIYLGCVPQMNSGHFCITEWPLWKRVTVERRLACQKICHEDKVLGKYYY